MEIINVYKQAIPAVKFIGKKYNDTDRVNGGFGFAWQQWLEQKWCDPIIEAAGGIDALTSLYEDGFSNLGYMRYKEGEPFEYWIGIFAPPETEIPNGYDGFHIEASNCGICWYSGQEPDIYGKEDLAMRKLEELGMTLKTDKQGAFWFFERYVPARFDEKDENGNITLDIGFYVE